MRVIDLACVQGVVASLTNTLSIKVKVVLVLVDRVACTNFIAPHDQALRIVDIAKIAAAHVVNDQVHVPIDVVSECRST